MLHNHIILIIYYITRLSKSIIDLIKLIPIVLPIVLPIAYCHTGGATNGIAMAIPGGGKYVEN